MSEKHEYKLEKFICKCKDNRCKFSYVIKPESAIFIPTQNDKELTNDKTFNTKLDAIRHAYKIAKQCPNYNKTR
jgi:hypothetical protein